MAKYDWLLFDLDNTILDFDANSKLAFSAILSHFDIEEEPHFYTLYKQINKHVWWEMEVGRIPQQEVRTRRFDLFYKVIGFQRDALVSNVLYFEHLAHNPQFVKGAREILTELSQQFKLCVITNGMKDVQNQRLDNANLRPLFEHVVISDEIGVAKPHKEYFDHVFELIDDGRKSASLVIGDNLSSDIKGAVNYGLDSCWYNPGGMEKSEDIYPTYEIDELIKLLPLLV